MLSTIFTNPRTTLAGLWMAVASPLGIYIVPAIVTYFGSQPGLGWQIVGGALGLVLPFFMRDTAKPAAQISPAPKP